MAAHVAESIRYYSEPGRLVVDLRSEGVSYMPVASRRSGLIRTDAPRLHVHPGLVEICYCLRGSLAFETPEREYAFLPGCVFVSREDEPHRMKANPKGLFVYRVMVRLPPHGGVFDGLDAADSEWLAARIQSLPRRFMAVGDSLKQAFDALFAAYADHGCDSSRRRVELRRRALDILLATVDAGARPFGAMRYPQVEAWARRMERDPLADYTIAEMSRATRLPGAVFTRAFKASVGLPPGAWLRNCRIRSGMKMLEDGLSVTAVALRLGFSSAQYFATAFKAETGASPRDWRKRAKRSM